MPEMCEDVAPSAVAARVPPPAAGEIYTTPWCHLPLGHTGPHKCGEYVWRNETAMGRTSELMTALVAVSRSGKAVLLEVWPPTTSPADPWGCELEASGGSDNLEDLGLTPPKQSGLWWWSGTIWYSGPDVEGNCDSDPT